MKTFDTREEWWGRLNLQKRESLKEKELSSSEYLEAVVMAAY